MIILKFIHGLMLMVMITGCTDQAKSTAEILQDGQRREEIMVAISKDHEMMNEMMDHMMKNDYAIQMMEGHRGMIGKMMSIMKKDSTMSNIMGGMMMGNKHMMSMMQQMGKSGGMMPHNRQ